MARRPIRSEAGRAAGARGERLGAGTGPLYADGLGRGAAHGVPRSTLDLDIVIAPTRAELEALLEQFPGSEYYADKSQAHAALASRGMFNVIDIASGWKVDFIIAADSLYAGPAPAACGSGAKGLRSRARRRADRQIGLGSAKRLRAPVGGCPRDHHDARRQPGPWLHRGVGRCARTWRAVADRAARFLIAAHAGPPRSRHVVCTAARAVLGSFVITETWPQWAMLLRRSLSKSSSDEPTRTTNFAVRFRYGAAGRKSSTPRPRSSRKAMSAPCCRSRASISAAPFCAAACSGV